MIINQCKHCCRLNKTRNKITKINEPYWCGVNGSVANPDEIACQYFKRKESHDGCQEKQI